MSNPCYAAFRVLVFVGLLSLGATGAQAAEPPRLQLEPGQKLVLIGNTLAERMQYFGHVETQLHTRFPRHELVVRNLGWSADEVALRPRSLHFEQHGHRLEDHQPDVIWAFFGFNESFAGEAGLPKFRENLRQFVTQTSSTKYNGKAPPKLVLFSPIAHENLGRREFPDGSENNRRLALYTAAMREVAAEQSVLFVDLFTPSKQLMDSAASKLTINGVHLNEQGERQIARVIGEQLFGPSAEISEPAYERLRAEINEKNQQFFHDHRAVNGYYIYGGRKSPYGVANFPEEFPKLRRMIALRDQRVWAVAQGKPVSPVIDDAATGELPPTPTNAKSLIRITSPEEARQKFNLAPGYEVRLFASEVQFPELKNPVQFTFDARGRLWVCTMPTYPMYLPGAPPQDKILILEDVDGDGSADTCKVFADGLHLPTGIELGDGGAYVAQQPNLVFLKDTTGDDVADERTLVLHGFDSADSHHAISAFTWDQGGALYFQEGTFHRTQVESPYGPQRCADAGVFRWEPRTGRFSVFASYGFSNPWGHVVDRWGQNFIADASPGANFFGTAMSGDVDFPHKHALMNQFLVKQWRPTCGCELVSSRNFPAEAQGNYLLNNCIGFQGVLQYKMKEEKSGFRADPVDPLLSSSDPNFRPVDIKFGPDGGLYLCDWFNPLIGHMQHSLRDPNRDKSHGRIWRVHYSANPLVKPAQIAGQEITNLLQLFETQPEERTRHRVRMELRNRETSAVLSAAKAWLAGLDPKNAEFEHHRLEVLWLHQQHDMVNLELLTQVLKSPEPKARAAATRVLCCWRDRIPQVLPLLETQVNDAHPRVRLEAVRALSFFASQAALDIAVQSLIHEQDYYLEYTLNETLKTVERRVNGVTNLPHVKTQRELLNEREEKGLPKGAKKKPQ